MKKAIVVAVLLGVIAFGGSTLQQKTAEGIPIGPYSMVAQGLPIGPYGVEYAK